MRTFKLVGVSFFVTLFIGLIFCFLPVFLIYADEVGGLGLGGVESVGEFTDVASPVDVPFSDSDLPPIDNSDFDSLIYRLDELIDLLSPATPGVVEVEDLPLNPLLSPAGDEFVPVMAMRSPIGEAAAYPYTGGAFISVNTNYGNGYFVLPVNFKQNTLGFEKGSDRIVNLTNSTVSGYFIVGGTTYNLRFQSMGQAQQYYYQGTGYIWRDVTVTRVNDSNINWLDETSERGVFNPYFSFDTKFIVGVAFLGFVLLFVLRKVLK